MPRSRRNTIRDFEGGNYFDLFFITSIATILFTRLYLHLMDYPQIGGGGLHIAHMLWGGLGMLIAVVMLLLFLGRRTKYPAAFIGGIGFGLFIDELGKFITSDNDYFFQPTVALIYLIFVGMYLGVRSIHREQTARPHDYLVNALVEMEEVVVGDLEPDERRRIHRFLDASPQDDPLVPALRQVLDKAPLVPERMPHWFVRIRRRLDMFYRHAVVHPHFAWAMVLIALGLSVSKVISGVVVIFFAREPAKDSPTFYHLGDQARTLSELDLLDWIHASSYLASTAMAILGALLIFRHRLAAYRMFQRSILVGILVTQPFMFYRDQWSALIGLTFNVLLYVLTKYLIAEEKREEEAPTA